MVGQKKIDNVQSQVGLTITRSESIAYIIIDILLGDISTTQNSPLGSALLSP